MQVKISIRSDKNNRRHGARWFLFFCQPQNVKGSFHSHWRLNTKRSLAERIRKQSNQLNQFLIYTHLDQIRTRRTNKHVFFFFSQCSVRNELLLFSLARHFECMLFIKVNYFDWRHFNARARKQSLALHFEYYTARLAYTYTNTNKGSLARYAQRKRPYVAIWSSTIIWVIDEIFGYFEWWIYTFIMDRLFWLICLLNIINIVHHRRLDVVWWVSEYASTLNMCGADVRTRYPLRFLTPFQITLSLRVRRRDVNARINMDRMVRLIVWQSQFRHFPLGSIIRKSKHYTCTHMMHIHIYIYRTKDKKKIIIIEDTNVCPTNEFYPPFCGRCCQDTFGSDKLITNIAHLKHIRCRWIVISSLLLISSFQYE